MEAYTYALDVMKAAEELIAHFPDAQNIFKACHGKGTFTLNCAAELKEISWDFYDKVYMDEHRLTYCPELRRGSTLCTYPSWDVLIEDMKTGDVMRRVIVI